MDSWAREDLGSKKRAHPLLSHAGIPYMVGPLVMVSWWVFSV